MAQKKLGRQLLDTLDDLTLLIEATHDEQRIKELDEQSSRLVKEIGRLVDAKLDSASAEYKAATRGLHDASVTIQNAIKGIDSIVAAVAAVAEALDLVAELAA